MMSVSDDNHSARAFVRDILTHFEHKQLQQIEHSLGSALPEHTKKLLIDLFTFNILVATERASLAGRPLTMAEDRQDSGDDKEAIDIPARKKKSAKNKKRRKQRLAEGDANADADAEHDSAPQMDDANVNVDSDSSEDKSDESVTESSDKSDESVTESSDKSDDDSSKGRQRKRKRPDNQSTQKRRKKRALKKDVAPSTDADADAETNGDDKLSLDALSIENEPVADEGQAAATGNEDQPMDAQIEQDDPAESGMATGNLDVDGNAGIEDAQEQDQHGQEGQKDQEDQEDQQDQDDQDASDEPSGKDDKDEKDVQGHESAIRKRKVDKKERLRQRIETIATAVRQPKFMERPLQTVQEIVQRLEQGAWWPASDKKVQEMVEDEKSWNRAAAELRLLERSKQYPDKLLRAALGKLKLALKKRCGKSLWPAFCRRHFGGDESKEVPKREDSTTRAEIAFYRIVNKWPALLHVTTPKASCFSFIVQCRKDWQRVLISMHADVQKVWKSKQPHADFIALQGSRSEEDLEQLLTPDVEMLLSSQTSKTSKSGKPIKVNNPRRILPADAVEQEDDDM